MGAKGNELTAPGKLFDVGGRRLHAVVTGEEQGKRPVVLEAGLTATSSCWAWIQEELSKTTKVLAYDRAGLGWSDPTGEPKDACSIAKDLHGLIDVAKFPRPFVFVGHSMGGIFGRAYALMYPQDIAGMALIDASHPEQIERSPNIKKALGKFFWFLKGSPNVTSRGVAKVCGDFGMSSDMNSDCASQHMRETVREAEQWFTSAGQVKDQKLGDVPLITITAPQKCMQGWLDLQRELSQISTRGRHVVLNGASHVTILTDKVHAKRVAEEVAYLL